ncbi:CoA-transferase family III [Aspergillus sclerotioniger CBS 115572]|uniref:CoA-transferase family III n=1 Tax=Aspergillus sclerotioniger CBS 115572 TaxID=1450535 RepID=A0A317WF97_9EURO|nr:CoA-transferase family III [Aspergillus sclerotioniger CBS 115572]PWY83912.1 CoA-transferase family III [Aspergillus sclerotioniger CBS 115572]
MTSHETTPSTDIYGPGTYVDKTFLPAPQDARRIFEYIAKSTPGFTQNQDLWNTVDFQGSSLPIIPGPFKAPLIAAALHAMCGVVAHEIIQDRDGTAASTQQVNINVDHAAIWLGTIFAASIEGKDMSELVRTRQLPTLFKRDFEGDFMSSPMRQRTTALYKTKTPGVWYQLHGSLNAAPVLQALGIDPNYPAKNSDEAYEHIARHVEQWAADELEMLNIKNGFCGSICFTPQGWDETSMGKRLAAHPLVGYSRQRHAIPTPPVPLPKVQNDRRPLAGIKVVELVRIIAGPVIGNTLAAMGADVIRVGCSRLTDLNVLQLTLNAGKRTIDLDLTKEEDKSRLRDLISGADVFIQGFRPNAIARKGFGVNDLLEMAGTRGKGIVYVEENCYGPDGPYHERPGWQQIGDAASGSSYVMGRSLGFNDGTSILPPLPISDMTTGLVGALGALMALRDRARHGDSYRVTSSLVKADAIALEPEIGLYSPEVVEKSKQVFQWGYIGPSLFVTEILLVVMDGWKRVFPQYFGGGDESLLMSFEEGPWGKMEILRPVVRLGDDDVTPRWLTPAVPNCYHGRSIDWL